MKASLVVELRSRLVQALDEFHELVKLLFETSSVLSRFESTGRVSEKLARDLGLVGVAARASHVAGDVRQDYPCGMYRTHPIPPVMLSSGDVYARARVRSLESKRSLEYLLALLKELPSGDLMDPSQPVLPSAMVVSLVEGWRGEIAHIVLTDEQGGICRYKIVDPSFHNWMALSMAMRNNQISDFPLCNKSFNLSYAGHDL